MHCVSYNIQYGLGADGRYDLARTAASVETADIIALQEVDRYWQRSGMVDSPVEIARCLPQHHWVFGANLDMDASYMADGRTVHRRKQFGTMILSRWPILSSRNHLLPKWGDRRLHSIQQGTLEAVIDAPGGALRVYSVHLSHLCPATRLTQIDALKALVERAPGEGGAWCGGHPEPESGWIEETEPPMPRAAILMGDFNFAPDSAEYAAMIGPFTERFGRLALRDGWYDAWVEAGHAEDSGSSHPNAGQRIDHCFVNAELAGRIRSCRIDDTTVASDHWPVWTELD